MEIPSANTEVLKKLLPGDPMSIYPDYAALEAGKIGLLIFSGIFLVLAIYLAAVQFGVISSFLTTYVRKPFFIWLGVALALAVSYLLYDKTTIYDKLADGKPILQLLRQTIDYDTRIEGWTMRWADIKAVELKTTHSRKKVAEKQITQEIRIVPREDAFIRWKNIPDAIEKLQAPYLVIDPGPLNVDPETLQQALERYREGVNKTIDWRW